VLEKKPGEPARLLYFCSDMRCAMFSFMDCSWWVAIGISVLCIGITFFFEVRFYRKYPDPREREEKFVQFLDQAQA